MVRLARVHSMPDVIALQLATVDNGRRNQLHVCRHEPTTGRPPSVRNASWRAPVMYLRIRHAKAAQDIARFKTAPSIRGGAPSHSQQISSPVSLCVDGGTIVC